MIDRPGTPQNRISCIVALPIHLQPATNATGSATNAQLIAVAPSNQAVQKAGNPSEYGLSGGIKELAAAVLERNQSRNKPATNWFSEGVKNSPIVARKVASVTAEFDPAPDDRRTCFVCLNFRAGRCLAAWRGELQNTARKYRPDPERFRRCEGYQPGPDDPDRRHGRERWPGLTRQEAAR